MNLSREESIYGSIHSVPGSNKNSEDGQLTWSKLCSQHESVLSSHLAVLNSAKQLARSEDEHVLRAISSMLDQTNILMTQFHVVKNQLMNSSSASGQDTRSQSEPTQSCDGRASTSTSSSPKKRARAGNESSEISSGNNVASEKGPEGRLQKRKRLDVPIPPGSHQESVGVTPTTTETEDISEEVQRRLEIKEGQRRKRCAARPEKRKRDRDSMSNDNDSHSSSLGSTGRSKKRRRELEDGE